jgi:hypothetical protein
MLWDAALEHLFTPLLTPNPAKAPLYFLGLQELLHYFPPIVAGIVIPGLVVVGLIVIPYFDVNIKGEPLSFTGRNARLWRFEGSLALMILILSFYRAWTVSIPTAFIAGLALIAPLFSGTRMGKYLRMRPLSWWIMTWFVAVSSTLNVVETFFRSKRL